MMASVLLDTNAVSDLMRDHARLLVRVSTFLDQLMTSAVVVGEIRYGLDRLPAGKKRTDLESRAGNILAKLPAQPVTFQVGDAYGRLKAALAAQGLSIDDNDLWISATALVHNAILVTRDKVFTNIPGLHVEDWTL